MADLAELDLVIDSSQVRQGTSDLKTFTGAAGAAEQAANKFGASARKASTSNTAFANTARFAVTQIAQLAAASAGLIAIENGVRAIAEFDRVMVTLSGTIEGTTKDFSDLRNQAKLLGATTKFSAGQAAQAQLELARAGQDANAVLATTPKVLSLAVGQELQLAESAKIVTQTMAQFKLEAGDAGRIVDTFTIAANKAQTSVPALSAALKNAGVVSAQTGKSFEDTTAAIALLQDTGLEGAEAGTALKTTMDKLLNPVGRAGKLLDQLAKRTGDTREVFDASKHTFVEVFGALNKAGASTKDLIAIFGSEGFNAASILTGAPERLKLFTDAMNGSEDAAKKLEEIMNNTLVAAFDNVTSAIESLFIEAGDSGLTGTLKDLLNLIADAIVVLSGLETGMADTSTAANALANVIKAVSVGFAVFLALSAASKIAASAKAIGGLTGAFRALNMAMKANPILLVASLIALLVLALIELSEEYVTIGDDTIRIGNIMQATWEAATAYFSAVWEEAVLRFGELWEKSVQFVMQVVEVWKRVFTNASTDSLAPWQKALAVLLKIMKGYINTYIGLTVSFVQVVIRAVDRIFKAFQALANVDFSSFTSFAQTAIEADKAFAEAFSLNNFGKDVIATFRDNWGKDFVAAGVDIATETAASMSAAFNVSDILARAKELQRIEDAAKKTRDEGKTKRRTGGTAASGRDLPQVSKQAADARKELEKLIQSLKDEKILIGTTDAEKRRAEVLTRVRDLMKEIFHIPEGSELFTAKQAKALDVVHTNVRALLESTEKAQAFEELRDRGTEALKELSVAAKGAREDIAFNLASPRQRVQLEVERDYADQIKSVNDLLVERFFLGKKTDTQAAAASERLRQDIQELSNVRFIAQSFQSAQQALDSFQADMAKSGEAFRSSILSTEFGGRVTQLTAQLTEPLKLVRSELANLRDAGALTAEQYTAAMQQIVRAEKEASDFATNAVVLERVRAVSQTVSAELGNMFKSVILGTKTAEQAAADFFAALADTLLTQVVIQPLVDLLSTGITKAIAGATGMTASAATAATTLASGGVTAGQAMVAGATTAAAILRAAAVANSVTSGVSVGAANGAVYQAGTLAFAKGGIVSRSTTFPLKNGMTGLMGEAGPEAIMPLMRVGGKFAIESNAGPLMLQRQADGKLGVAAFANGGVVDEGSALPQPLNGQRTFVGEEGKPAARQVVNFNITTPAPSGFKASTNQLARQIKRVTRGK